MKEINVHLYGGKGLFGGKETPLEASIISCDKYEQCSYFKNNQCLKVRSFLSPGCKYGRVNNVKGYTSRAAKYHSFKRQWQEHERYSKLKYPPQKLGLIGDEIVFPYPYIRITQTEDGNVKLSDPGFGPNIAFIAKENFTIDLIKRICNFRPCAIMGGVIADYQNKIVPLFLAHLKEILPDIYEELRKEDGDLVKEVSYIGRKALLKTVNPSDVYYRNSNYPQFNETWHWDGETLTYSSGYVHDFSITKDYAIAEIKIIPSDKSVITITSNEQVTGETVFID